MYIAEIKEYGYIFIIIFLKHSLELKCKIRCPVTLTQITIHYVGHSYTVFDDWSPENDPREDAGGLSREYVLRIPSVS